METKRIYDVYDIERLLNCKQAKAYNVIRELNKELKAMGSKITMGKIPAKYFHERYRGFENESPLKKHSESEV